MSVTSHISVRWLLWVARVLESAERIWQSLNPIPSDGEHCVVSASVTSDNCQLVLQHSPFRAEDNAVSLPLFPFVWLET